MIKVAGECAHLTAGRTCAARQRSRAARDRRPDLLPTPLRAGWSSSMFCARRAQTRNASTSVTPRPRAAWEGRSVSKQIDYLLDNRPQGAACISAISAGSSFSRSENLKRLVLELCEAGYRRRLLFSADANYKWDESATFGGRNSATTRAAGQRISPTRSPTPSHC